MHVQREWSITKENASNHLNVHHAWRNILKGQPGKMTSIHVSSIFVKIALFDLLNTDAILKCQLVANTKNLFQILPKSAALDMNVNATKTNAQPHQPVPKVSIFNYTLATVPFILNPRFPIKNLIL